MLQVAKSCLSKQCLISLYHAFFQSHLSYAILYWSSGNSTLIQTITILQKCTIKIIFGAKPRSHTQPIANTLNILLFDDFVYYKQCLFMFNVFHNRLPAIFVDMFNILVCKYVQVRQHNCNLIISRCKLKKSKTFIVQAGPFLWNDLLHNIKQISSVHIFKNVLSQRF